MTVAVWIALGVIVLALVFLGILTVIALRHVRTLKVAMNALQARAADAQQLQAQLLELQPHLEEVTARVEQVKIRLDEVKAAFPTR